MFSSSGFEVQIAHSVEEIDPEVWDCLAANRPFASYRWYRFGEKVLADSQPIYIILFQQKEPVARATFWLTRQEPLPISSELARRLVGAVLRRWPVLFCRSPWRTETTGLILPDSPCHDEALTTITQVAWEQARQHQASFLVFDYLEYSDVEGVPWPEPLVPTTLSGPGTRLTITWPDFENYLKHLSKSARKDYRRHRNRAADLNVRVSRHPTATLLGEAMVLIRNVEKRHQAAPDPWARLALENAGMVDATWLTAEIGERLVGCGLLIGDGKTRILKLMGLDYDARYAYFQLIYEAIRCAIEDGVQVLRGGSGSYEIKQRLGFELEHNNYITFAASNRALRWAGRQLSAMI